VNFANDCANDLKEKIATVQVGTPDGRFFKAVLVYNVEDLLGAIKNLRPAVGIVYEGARSIDTGTGGPARTTDKVGASGEVVFSLVLVAEVSVLSQLADTMTNAHVLLDSLRAAIQGTRSPTGHKWKWVLEAPAATKSGAAVWIQRYSCPVQTPPA
jgi:hypothetical protein